CRFRGGGTRPPPCHARQKPFLRDAFYPTQTGKAPVCRKDRATHAAGTKHDVRYIYSFSLPQLISYRRFCGFPSKKRRFLRFLAGQGYANRAGHAGHTSSRKRRGEGEGFRRERRGAQARAGELVPDWRWCARARARGARSRPEAEALPGVGWRRRERRGRGAPAGHGELIGLDPHNPKKKQDLDKLYDLKAKAQQIMNQFGPSALINLSNFSSIKQEPGSTPPQSSMANSTTVAKMPGTPSGGGRLSPESNQVLTKKKLQDLVREVDPNEQLDEDVEEMLLQIADDFIESVVTAACQLARHRKSNTLEVKDVQLHLERQWNMWIPGFGSEEIRPYKKACTTEAHKQRMALIRKTTKK
uniref:Transcription initiation factor TFIID subunit 12 n=2 Tax=Taeniopygia guttata TaxID=59729 RepID=H0YR34_TAEGU